MKFSIGFIFCLMFLISCGQSNDSKNETKKTTIKESIIEAIEEKTMTESPLIQAFFKIPDEHLKLSECGMKNSKSARRKLIQDDNKIYLSFMEPCNGTVSQFGFIKESNIYFLGLCDGGPGCNQKVRIYNKAMEEINNAYDPNSIENFLNSNALIKKRLLSLNPDIDLSESAMLSFNPVTASLQLIPDPEFVEETIPLGRTTFTNKKLLITK